MNSDAESPSEYLAPYEKAAAQHGASFEATLWANEDYQQRRFEVFAELFDFEGAAIVDAGAGKGDFAAFLNARGIRWKRYVGLEAVAAMAQAGRGLNLPDAQFIEADFVRDAAAFARVEPDVIVFSGSLNTMPQRLALRVLERAWRAAESALLFNFLSDRGPQGGAAATPAKRFDTLRMLDWALKRTPSVVLRHEYLAGHDATIGMWKFADHLD